MVFRIFLPPGAKKIPKFVYSLGKTAFFRLKCYAEQGLLYEKSTYLSRTLTPGVPGGPEKA